MGTVCQRRTFTSQLTDRLLSPRASHARLIYIYPAHRLSRSHRREGGTAMQTNHRLAHQSHSPDYFHPNRDTATNPFPFTFSTAVPDRALSSFRLRQRAS
ncbi:hypothetical protein NDU88_005541 [Pleurodeles waltl]|uniref:Uncharacterized protein n=1 Tax=Pleurodeles waltl TaxID=8319 RepID=A0AAV7L4B9_PLEWA|nr:hypothetical protein NDU88_005541 [Pleurodeles waltl]